MENVKVRFPRAMVCSLEIDGDRERRIGGDQRTQISETSASATMAVSSPFLTALLRKDVAEDGAITQRMPAS